MKLRYLTVFILCFVAFFVLLNVRLLIAEVGYSLAAPQSTLTPLTATQVTPLPQIKFKTSDAATIIINKIGVSAPIVFGVSEKIPEIYKNLDRGVVHYSLSPKPGEKGASMILGHSSDYPWKKNPYGSAFALLSKLSKGDVIQVKYDNGSTLNFSVKDSIIFNPLSEDARLARIENASGSSIVLISCWPVGTSLKRIAIQADLI